MTPRETAKRKKLKGENQRLAYLADFESMDGIQLRERKAVYLRMRRVALSNGKKELVALCNGRLKKIDEEIKLRG